MNHAKYQQEHKLTVKKKKEKKKAKTTADLIPGSL